MRGRKPSFGFLEQPDLPITPAPAAHALIDCIKSNPLPFIWNPTPFTNRFSEAQCREALLYFSREEPSRFTHDVCTAYFNQVCPGFEILLRSETFLEWNEGARLWPFWHAAEMDQETANELSDVGTYLETLWNFTCTEPSALLEGRRPTPNPLMLLQTGPLTLMRSTRVFDCMFFKCSIPIEPPINPDRDGSPRRYKGYFVIAFDVTAKAFYSVNLKIRCADPEQRYRYLEVIDSDLSPPAKIDFDKKLNILVVLDRHIGDSLSLLSTHVHYLSEKRNISLSVDVSRCPFLKSMKPAELSKFLPRSGVSVLNSLPSFTDFDYVFDPYDLVPGIFRKKVYNDSGLIGIVSGLEFGICVKNNIRRDIMDIHMSVLRRLGIAEEKKERPEFVRYYLSEKERDAVRTKARSSLFGLAPYEGRKIVSFFPFGLTEERKFPVSRLRTILRHLFAEMPNVYIIIASSDFDTAEIVSSVTAIDRQVLVNNRVKLLMNEPFEKIVNAMLASDVVVSMDSGPLHLARALRIRPLGIYTAKVNSAELFLSFPWFVDDGTVEVLKPAAPDPHVSVDLIIQRIKARLSGPNPPQQMSS